MHGLRIKAAAFSSKDIHGIRAPPSKESRQKAGLSSYGNRLSSNEHLMCISPRHPFGPISLSILLALSTSCLVVDSLEEQETTHSPGNMPPRILEETVEPKNGSVIFPESCALLLSIGAVEELDLTDELMARWFVDEKLLSSHRLPAQDEIVRPGPSYAFEVARHTPGMHVVLVSISDGFADGEDLRAAREGKAVVSYEWAIDTSAIAACVDLESLPVDPIHAATLQDVP